MLHRWHQFFRPTKTKSRAVQRGNISFLSLWWICITIAGCLAIASATSVVHKRAVLQSSADVIALAHVTRGEQSAQLLAHTLGVTITRVEISTTQPLGIIVRIKSQWGSATAEASARG